jgi:hypothetical protein
MATQTCLIGVVAATRGMYSTLFDEAVATINCVKCSQILELNCHVEKSSGEAMGIYR